MFKKKCNKTGGLPALKLDFQGNKHSNKDQSFCCQKTHFYASVLWHQLIGHGIQFESFSLDIKEKG